MSPYGAKVTPDAKKDADAIKGSMMAGDFVIFKGPMKDNKGAHGDRLRHEPHADRLHAGKHELSRGGCDSARSDD